MPLKDIEARRAYDRARPQRKISKTRRNMLSYRYHLNQRYGLSYEDYKLMVRIQRAACAICERIPNKSLSVDHNHTTNQVRGLLCQGCNLIVGLLETQPDRVEGCKAYLDLYNAT